jgi:hypothetical protein
MSQIGDGFILVGRDPVVTLVTTTHPVCKAARRNWPCDCGGILDFGLPILD